MEVMYEFMLSFLEIQVKLYIDLEYNFPGRGGVSISHGKIKTISTK